MDKEKIKKVRRGYIVTSILLGVISPLLCYWLIPGFSPKTHPLSYFGVVDNTSMFWLVSLIIIAIGIWINGEYRVDGMIKQKQYVKPLKTVLRVSSVSLVFTSIFTMELGNVHNLSAVMFFITYSFFIFSFGLVRSLTAVRRGLFSVVISCLMVFSSLLLIPYPSYGVAEYVFIVLVSIWNSKVFWKSL